MTSFTRTIPRGKSSDFVRSILSRTDHYLPLTFQPTRAKPGDFLYLVHRGEVVGRAQIAYISSAAESGENHPLSPPGWAKWLIHYQGSWQKPPRNIKIQGHQGVRYLDSQGLTALDQEAWPAWIDDSNEDE